MTSDVERFADISEAADLLRGAENLVALTGAGISLSAGIPIYRGSDNKYLDEENEWWVWRESFDSQTEKWYKRFWELHSPITSAAPTPGHLALSAMVEAGILSDIVTQNVDGLDLKAGTDEEHVYEVHGTERLLSCTNEDGCETTVLTDEWLQSHEDTLVPTCEKDGQVLKPDVNLYHEPPLPRHVSKERRRVAQAHPKGEQVMTDADALLVVGTSLNVAPWRQIVIGKFLTDTPVVVVTPEPIHLDKYLRLTHILRTADEGLQLLQEELSSYV
jgi:NAD-dependent deacetylase